MLHMKGLGAKRVISILVKLNKLTFKTSALIMESTVYMQVDTNNCIHLFATVPVRHHYDNKIEELKIN